MDPSEVTVLVVEDDEFTRMATVGILCSIGYTTNAVENGQKALEELVAHSSTYDLVLCDVMLPVMNGIQLLDELQKQPDIISRIPVVMTSSNEEMDVVTTCLSKGAKDYLIKPIQVNTAKTLVRHVWLSRRQERSSGSQSLWKDMEIVRVIGRGTHGVVQLARRKLDSAEVAVKRIRTSLISENGRKQADNEVILLKSLYHVNIVRFYDHFMVDDELNIVMEYADGGNLRQLVKVRAQEKMGPFPEAVIMSWFAQLVLAVAYIHGKNVLHRDLKAQNVFLTRRNVVKLGDFGISKALAGDESALTACGTPESMSPEICRGEPYGKKSDIWSLGCVLYEMIMCRRPFEANNLPDIFAKICKGDYPPIDPHFSRELRLLVQLMLQLDHTKRPSIEDICRFPFVQIPIQDFLSKHVTEFQEALELEAKLHQPSLHSTTNEANSTNSDPYPQNSANPNTKTQSQNSILIHNTPVPHENPTVSQQIRSNVKYKDIQQSQAQAQQQPHNFSQQRAQPQSSQRLLRSQSSITPQQSNNSFAVNPPSSSERASSTPLKNSQAYPNPDNMQQYQAEGINRNQHLSKSGKSPNSRSSRQLQNPHINGSSANSNNNHEQAHQRPLRGQYSGNMRKSAIASVAVGLAAPALSHQTSLQDYSIATDASIDELNIDTLCDELRSRVHISDVRISFLTTLVKVVSGYDLLQALMGDFQHTEEQAKNVLKSFVMENKMLNIISASKESSPDYIARDTYYRFQYDEGYCPLNMKYIYNSEVKDLNKGAKSSLVPNAMETCLLVGNLIAELHSSNLFPQNISMGFRDAKLLESSRVSASDSERSIKEESSSSDENDDGFYAPQSRLYRKFLRAVARLQCVDLVALPKHERQPFFINTYNTMMLHGFIEYGIPQNASQYKAFERDVRYQVGGEEFSLGDIKHGILRCNRKPPANYWERQLQAYDPKLQFRLHIRDPRSLLVLIDAYDDSNSSNNLLPVPGSVPLLKPGRVDTVLEEHVEAFCKQYVQIDEENRTISLPRVFRVYRDDFGASEAEMVFWLTQYMEKSPPNLTYYRVRYGSGITS